MPKYHNELNLSRQKRALLLLEWATGFHPAGSIWVLLLALRGFSLSEIAMAVNALAYNLQSGIREAITYESMLQAGREARDVLRFDKTVRRIMLLNARFPSSARATLVSVSSMAFSLVMIPLSPLFGRLFS